MIDNLEEKKKFFDRLDERQKRQFAAIEANSIGWHGVLQVSQAFDIHPHTIRRGQAELEAAEELPAGKVRKAGGGRKKSLSKKQES